jgi:hypothetical protein
MAILALLLAVNESPVQIGAATTLDNVVTDDFVDTAGTSITDHTPDTDEVGDGWFQSAPSDFLLDGSPLGAVSEPFHLNQPFSSIVDTLLAEYELSVRIKRDVEDNTIGVVLRYVDEDNYFAAIHDGTDLKLIKVVGGTESVVDSKKFKWNAGKSKTLKVKLEDDEFKISVDKKVKITAIDSDLAGATHAGIYYKSDVRSRFESLEVDALAPAPGPEPSPTPNAPVAEDSFTGTNGTLLDAHDPDIDDIGDGWEVLRGFWEIEDGEAHVTALDGPFDQVAVIEHGYDDVTIEADIHFDGGTAGIAYGVQNDLNNHNLVFFNGDNLFAAILDDGAFVLRRIAAVDASRGADRNLRVKVNGDSARIYLDGEMLFLFSNAMPMGTAKNAGIFTAGTTANTFDNFSIRESLPLSTPDIDLPLDPVFVPPLAVIPNDAWVYDSFNHGNFSFVDFLPLDLDPSGAGWSAAEGFWITFGGRLTSQARVYDPNIVSRVALIDSGRDQYEFSTDITWHGDRIGVLFGAKSDGPDTLTQNHFLFWKDGSGKMILSKSQGGAVFPIEGKFFKAKNVDWKEGDTKTLRVVVDGTHAKLHVDKKKVFDFHDDDLAYGTHVGIFERGKHDESFDDFKITLLDDAVAPFPEAGVKVNFQTKKTVTPRGFTPDIGKKFGDRPGVFDYGWDEKFTKAPKERESVLSPTVEHDTLFDPSKINKKDRDSAWELELAPGTYDIRVVAGDPDNHSEIRLSVEDISVIDGTTSLLEPFLDTTTTIPVVDGRLTLRSMNVETAVLVNFIEIHLVGPAPPPDDTIRINFQPKNSWSPTGYDKDYGSTFGIQSNGHIYGWNKKNDKGDEDFNSPLSPDQRYDTLLPLQHGKKPGTPWELALPNGIYTVEIVAGSAEELDAFYSFDIEGVAAIGESPTPSERWFEETVFVEVLDGRLTIDNGAGADNNAINFVHVTPGGPNNVPEILPQIFNTAEDSGFGTSVGIAVATDLDVTDVIDFQIIGGTGATAFAIDSASGEITVVDESQLDFEATPIFTLEVQVFDGEDSASATMTINLSDGPEFSIDPDLFDFTLVGQAVLQPDRLTVVPALFNDVGAAWYTPAGSPQHNVGAGFNAIFSIQLTPGTAIPADGFGFVIQNDSVNAIGSPSSPGYEGIPKSIAVEFDVFQNGGIGELSDRHIGVMTRGDDPNDQNHNFSGLAYTDSLIDFADGTIHDVRVEYIAGTPGTLNVYLDDLTTPVLSTPLDLAATISLNGGSAWVGMTAGTGGLFSNHDLISWDLVTPPEANLPPVIAPQDFVVDEDAPNGTAFGTIEATDPNLSDTLSFLVTGGSGSTVFAVAPGTGDVTLINAAALDFDTTSAYSLEVEVSDGLETDSAFMTIDVNPFEVVDTLGQIITAASPRDLLGVDALISDPDSNIGITNVIGNEFDGVDWLYWAPYSPQTRIYSKIPSAAAPLSTSWLMSEMVIAGDAPGKRLNSLSDADGIGGSAQWEASSGQPTGILGTEWIAGSQTFTTSSFTQDDVAITLMQTSGIPLLRSNMSFNNSGVALIASVDADPAGDVIVIDAGVPRDGTGSRYLVLAITDPVELAVTTTYQDPFLPIASGQTAAAGTTIHVGLETSVNTLGDEAALLFAVDDSLPAALARVRAAMAVGAAATAHSTATADWDTYLSPVDYSDHSPREQYSVSVALNQIRAHMVGDRYLTAATHLHVRNWVRDTSFAALGTADYLPETAKDILSFFAIDGTGDVDDAGIFDVTGGFTHGEDATERAATFLWAVGHTYSRSPDLIWAALMRDQAVAAVDYYSSVYDPVEKHILAEHTHDWWDQYQGTNIDVGLVKYEAEIDIMASHGLSQIEQMLLDLGEIPTATAASNMAAGLRSSIGDYISAPGEPLAYAIKTDDTLYTDSGLFTTPTQVFAGYVFDIENGYNEIINRELDLVPAGTTSASVGRPAILSAPSIDEWSDAELFWEIFLSSIDRDWGNGDAYADLHNFSILGTLPVKFIWNGDHRAPSGKSLSFPWHYGNLMTVTRAAVEQRLAQQMSIAENSPFLTPVGTVVATDPALVAPFDFNIVGGDGQTIFDVHPVTGLVTVLVPAPLDFEAVSGFVLEVEITDAVLATQLVTVQIDVTDLNDLPTISPQLFDIDENSANGTSLGSVEANDSDFADNLAFTVIGGTGASAFDVDLTTGEITVADQPQLDFETTPSFTLDVQVSDGTDTAWAIMTLDINDIVEATIDPDLLDFTVVGQASLLPDRLRVVPATFNDVGAAWYTPAASPQHDVASGFDAVFEFELSLGTPIPADGLAFVIQNESIGAIGFPSSAGFDGITESIAVEFDMFLNTPLNDSSPRHIAVMTRGSAPNSKDHLLAGIGNVDTLIDFADGLSHTGRVEYIAGTPGTLNVYLDDLLIPVLSIPLDLASTITLNSGSAWVGITAGTGGFFTNHDLLSWEFAVNSPANTPPAVVPQLFDIDENSTNGTFVDTIVATDLDLGDTLEYSVVGGTGATAFAVDLNTGDVTVLDQSQLDFETTPSFTLEIEVTDGIDISPATMTIDLNDLVEPLIDPDLLDFTLVGQASLLSDRLRVVPAIFNDVGAAWYTPLGSPQHDVSGGFDAVFEFELTPGTATPADGLAFVIQNESVGALGLPSSAGYVGITNSIAVEFDMFLNLALGDTSARHIAVMTRGSLPNSQDHLVAELGNVDTVIDFADGLSHTARVEYIGGAPGTLNVYLNDLIIPALSIPLDLASTISLNSGSAWVGITAGTGGLFSNHDLTSWEFAVMAAPNSPPSITPQLFDVDEESSFGTSVGIVSATDPDIGDDLEFAVIGGTGSTAFAIDIDSGEITVVDQLQIDFETTPSFTLDVEVSDGIDTASATMTIDLNDIVEVLIDPDLLDFTLVGQASLLADRLRVVPAIFNDVGAAWYTPLASPQHDVASGFNAVFEFELTPGTATPADGLALVIQNESVGALGLPSSAGYVGITESIAIEFDMFLNLALGDSSARHIAVMTRGSLPNSQDHVVAELGNVDTLVDFADGSRHTARVEYIAGAPGTLNVYLDDLVTPVLSISLDLASTINLNSGSAWVGITAGTGGLFSNHDLITWDFS